MYPYEKEEELQQKGLFIREKESERVEEIAQTSTEILVSSIEQRRLHHIPATRLFIIQCLLELKMKLSLSLSLCFEDSFFFNS